MASVSFVFEVMTSVPTVADAAGAMTSEAIAVAATASQTTCFTVPPFLEDRILLGLTGVLTLRGRIIRTRLTVG